MTENIAFLGKYEFFLLHMQTHTHRAQVNLIFAIVRTPHTQLHIV